MIRIIHNGTRNTGRLDRRLFSGIIGIWIDVIDITLSHAISQKFEKKEISNSFKIIVGRNKSL